MKWLFLTIIVSLTLVLPAKAQHFDNSYFEESSDFYFQIGDADDDGRPDILRGAGGREVGQVRGAIALGENDPRLVMVKVINMALGFLGMIFLLIILLGGFKLMVSGGNYEALTEAKKLFYSGVIGLIIIFSAFSAAKFIISALTRAVG